MEEFILKVNEIVKTFPGVRALDKVSLNVRKGEVHAIVGENGAGKSTLINILGGILKPDSGQILYDGTEVTFNGPSEAQEKDIGIVSQELSVIQTLSVAENILSNRQPTNKIGFINNRLLNEIATKQLDKFGLELINPRKLVKYLSNAEMQVVEILKAISLHPKVLIFDEPTSSLTHKEVVALFKNIRELKANGVSIIYISHHLNEIFDICDRVTVLKDGQYVCTEDVSSVDADYITSKMVGRELTDIFGEPRNRTNKQEQIIFEARGLSSGKYFNNINFKVKKGEILSFYGLIGAGRTELASGIFGLLPIKKGEIIYKGNKVRPRSPREAIDLGIAYMTEDRKNIGLYLDMNIEQNICSNRIKHFSDGFFVNNKKLQNETKDIINKFSVATPSSKQKLRKLSGGNQQKVLLSTWVGTNPSLLIVDEPTRGVDIGARSEIYCHLREIAESGTSVIVISSDLLEAINISDRIIVMRNGEISGEINSNEATEEKVIFMATES